MVLEKQQRTCSCRALFKDLHCNRLYHCSLKSTASPEEQFYFLPPWYHVWQCNSLWSVKCEHIEYMSRQTEALRASTWFTPFSSLCQDDQLYQPGSQRTSDVEPNLSKLEMDT